MTAHPSAITLHGPYGTLIAEGEKTVETRSRAYPSKLTGQRIIIHEGKHTDTFAAAAAERIGIEAHPGHVVATAILSGCYLSLGIQSGGEIARALNVHTFSRYTKPEDYVEFPIELWGDYEKGRYLWTLADVEALAEPIPARGYQWFWRWPFPQLPA